MIHIIDDFIAPPCPENIEILFKDEHLLLMNKPSGLLSLSGKKPCNKDSVHFRLTQDYPDATLVHRLDFGTSGIMIVALNKSINAHIGKQFQAGTVNKNYTAVLAGVINNDEGLIEYPIAKDPAYFPRQKICSIEGKKARTHYRVIQRYSDRTRVIFTPHTGRTHQLRIHSREFGHAILGCDLYGTAQTHAMAPRLLLHATTIEFVHPVTHLPMQGVAACPF